MTRRTRSVFIGLVALFAAVFGTAAAASAQADGPASGIAVIVSAPLPTPDNTIWG